jgi:hypothetical protein
MNIKLKKNKYTKFGTLIFITLLFFVIYILIPENNLTIELHYENCDKYPNKLSKVLFFLYLS